ncbi:MAG: WG repeat-containing protein [Cyclobacteriaceae bacterium]
MILYRFLPFTLLCLICSRLIAQDNQLIETQHLIDSLLQVAVVDSYIETIDETVELNEYFRTLTTQVYVDCNGDTCFEECLGLITVSNDTIPPVFYNIIPLINDEVVLIGLRKVIQLKSPHEVTDVYDHFGPIIDELAVITKNGRYGLMNTFGELLLPYSNDYIENNEDNHLILVQKDGMWTTHDKDSLHNVEMDDEFSGELINTLLKVQDPATYLWAIFSRNAVQLTPYKYEEVMFTAYGDATASIDGYWGMINEEGDEVTDIKYDEIRRGQGVTYIGVEGSLSEKYGLVSTEGELTATSYSQISTRPIFSDVTKSRYWVAKEVTGGWGLLALRGQPLSKFIYDEIDLKDENRPKGLTEGVWVELIK